MSAGGELVALVLAVHERRELTLRALRSLARAPRSDFRLETIVVDDGSRDDTAEAVARDFPQVRLLRADGTLFYAAATNLGLEAALAAGAHYVVAANDDSIFDPGTPAALVACARRHPRSLVGALLLSWALPQRVFQVGARWDTRYGGWRVPAGLDVWDVPPRPFEVETLAGNCLLLPAEALRKVGLMDARRFPQHWADLELVARVRRAGWRTLVEPRARVWCQPNASVTLRGSPWSVRLRALLRDRRHPLHLAQALRARWHSAPSRAQGVAASAVYLWRLGLYAAGRRGSWPRWPDPLPAWSGP